MDEDSSKALNTKAPEEDNSVPGGSSSRRSGDSKLAHEFWTVKANQNNDMANGPPVTVLLSSRVSEQLLDHYRVLSHPGVACISGHNSIVLYLTRSGQFRLTVPTFDLTEVQLQGTTYANYMRDVVRIYGFELNFFFTANWLIDPIVRLVIYNRIPQNVWTKNIHNKVKPPPDSALNFLSGIPEAHKFYQIVENIILTPNHNMQRVLLNVDHWDDGKLSTCIIFKLLKLYGDQIPFFAHVYRANKLLLDEQIEKKYHQFAEARVLTKAVKKGFWQIVDLAKSIPGYLANLSLSASNNIWYYVLHPPLALGASASASTGGAVLQVVGGIDNKLRRNTLTRGARNAIITVINMILNNTLFAMMTTDQGEDVYKFNNLIDERLNLLFKRAGLFRKLKSMKKENRESFLDALYKRELDSSVSDIMKKNKKDVDDLIKSYAKNGKSKDDALGVITRDIEQLQEQYILTGYDHYKDLSDEDLSNIIDKCTSMIDLYDQAKSIYNSPFGSERRDKIMNLSTTVAKYGDIRQIDPFYQDSFNYGTHWFNQERLARLTGVEKDESMEETHAENIYQERLKKKEKELFEKRLSAPLDKFKELFPFQLFVSATTGGRADHEIKDAKTLEAIWKEYGNWVKATSKILDESISDEKVRREPLSEFQATRLYNMIKNAVGSTPDDVDKVDNAAFIEQSLKIFKDVGMNLGKVNPKTLEFEGLSGYDSISGIGRDLSIDVSKVDPLLPNEIKLNMLGAMTGKIMTDRFHEVVENIKDRPPIAVNPAIDTYISDDVLRYLFEVETKKNKKLYEDIYRDIVKDDQAKVRSEFLSKVNEWSTVLSDLADDDKVKLDREFKTALKGELNKFIKDGNDASKQAIARYWDTVKLVYDDDIVPDAKGAWVGLKGFFSNLYDVRNSVVGAVDKDNARNLLKLSSLLENKNANFDQNKLSEVKSYLKGVIGGKDVPAGPLSKEDLRRQKQFTKTFAQELQAKFDFVRNPTKINNPPTKETEERMRALQEEYEKKKGKVDQEMDKKYENVVSRLRQERDKKLESITAMVEDKIRENRAKSVAQVSLDDHDDYTTDLDMLQAKVGGQENVRQLKQVIWNSIKNAGVDTFKEVFRATLSPAYYLAVSKVKQEFNYPQLANLSIEEIVNKQPQSAAAMKHYIDNALLTPELKNLRKDIRETLSDVPFGSANDLYTDLKKIDALIKSPLSEVVLQKDLKTDLGRAYYGRYLESTGYNEEVTSEKFGPRQEVLENQSKLLKSIFSEKEFCFNLEDMKKIWGDKIPPVDKDILTKAFHTLWMSLSDSQLFGSDILALGVTELFMAPIKLSREALLEFVSSPLGLVIDSLPVDVSSYVYSASVATVTATRLEERLKAVSQTKSENYLKPYYSPMKVIQERPVSWLNPRVELQVDPIRFYYQDRTSLAINKSELQYLIKEAFRANDNVYIPIVDEQNFKFDPSQQLFRIPNTVPQVLLIDEFDRVMLENIPGGSNILVKIVRKDKFLPLSVILGLQGVKDEQILENNKKNCLATEMTVVKLTAGPSYVIN